MRVGARIGPVIVDALHQSRARPFPGEEARQAALKRPDPPAPAFQLDGRGEVAVEAVKAALAMGSVDALDGIVFPSLASAVLGLPYAQTTAIAALHNDSVKGLFPIAFKVRLGGVSDIRTRTEAGCVGASLLELDAERTFLIERSNVAALNLNNAPFVFGCFVPKSYFAVNACSSRTFAEPRTVDHHLARMPYLVWNDDGSVQLRTRGLNARLLAEVERRGTPVALFRAELPCDTELMACLRAAAAPNAMESAVHHARRMFAERRDPCRTFLFTTVDRTWAEMFTRREGLVLQAFAVDTGKLSSAYRERIALGADGRVGYRRYHLEMALPFGTFDDAMELARAFVPTAQA